MPQLQSLRLSHNVLLRASLCHLAPGSRLTSLDLSSTNLTSLAWRTTDSDCPEDTDPATLPLLTTLDISNNYLDLAELELRETLPSLLSIKLGQLNLSSVGQQETAGLPQSLAEIHISNVPALEDFQPGALTQFRELELVVVTGNPALSSLPPSLLSSPLRSLTLNLSSNGLTWLHPSSLPWTEVALLDLSNNPLHCDCELTWLTQLQDLEGAVCASPPALANTNISSIDMINMSCSLLRPAQISVLSLLLVFASLLLGCVSFGK